MLDRLDPQAKALLEQLAAFTAGQPQSQQLLGTAEQIAATRAGYHQVDQLAGEIVWRLHILDGLFKRRRSFPWHGTQALEISEGLLPLTLPPQRHEPFLRLFAPGPSSRSLAWVQRTDRSAHCAPHLGPVQDLHCIWHEGAHERAFVEGT